MKEITIHLVNFYPLSHKLNGLQLAKTQTKPGVHSEILDQNYKNQNKKFKLSNGGLLRTCPSKGAGGPAGEHGSKGPVGKAFYVGLNFLYSGSFYQVCPVFL
jgi:hypothetical protein